MQRLTVLAVAALAALALAAGASAHAHLSPPYAVAGESQVFTLAVPTEKEGLTTTSVEFTAPDGFSIDSFVPSPGWKRSVEQTGSGEDATIAKVTWTGGATPTGEDSAFSFLARAKSAKTYAFKVRQTYSDGSIVNWTGSESSDTPAPTLEAKSSLGGGGGGSSTLDIVAIVLGALGLLAGGAALLTRGGSSNGAGGGRTLA
jgi:uncharacterized protein YcnI